MTKRRFLRSNKAESATPNCCTLSPVALQRSIDEFTEADRLQASNAYWLGADRDVDMPMDELAAVDRRLQDSQRGAAIVP
jgi:hypothetical protein